MPTPAYLTIEGTTQDNITKSAFTEDSVGNIYQEGHENEILVQAFEQELTVPVDPQSGQPAGQRHKAMTITKVFDKSSPLLYVALSTGERLTRCVLKWHRTSTSGTQDTILPRPWKMPASPTSHLRCPIARTLRNRILPT